MGITTKDLAKICGVSRTTIYRALSDTGRINPQTKDFILETVKKYDYRPDLLARGLVKGQTYNIGVVVLDVNNRYFAQMLSAIEVEARKQGYFVNITLHEKNPDIEKEQMARLVDYHVEGIILSSVNQGEEYKKFLYSLNTPIVTIDNRIEEGIPFVGINEREAARAATAQIIEKGYQKVVFVCPPLLDRGKENIYVHEEREKGFQEAMLCSTEVEAVIIDQVDYLDCCANQLIDGVKTAFFCSGDMFALKLMKHLKSLGKRAPKDYGIMGFDNIDVLDYVTPRLTTIDNSVDKIAKMAVDMLFDLIDGKATRTEILLDYLLVKGETI